VALFTALDYVFVARSNLRFITFITNIDNFEASLIAGIVLVAGMFLKGRSHGSRDFVLGHEQPCLEYLPLARARHTHVPDNLPQALV
jgi:hypothetical protein